MVIKITEKKYWDAINSISEAKPEKEWYSKSEEELDKEWFGLKLVEADLDYFLFKIINKKKYAWAKIRYDL